MQEQPVKTKERIGMKMEKNIKKTLKKDSKGITLEH